MLLLVGVGVLGFQASGLAKKNLTPSTQFFLPFASQNSVPPNQHRPPDSWQRIGKHFLKFNGHQAHLFNKECPKLRLPDEMIEFPRKLRTLVFPNLEAEIATP